MVGVVAGGPAPAAQAQATPSAEAKTDENQAQARQAAVAGSASVAANESTPKRPVAYGVNSDSSARETSAKYDARGKMAAEQDRRGSQVDLKA